MREIGVVHVGVDLVDLDTGAEAYAEFYWDVFDRRDLAFVVPGGLLCWTVSRRWWFWRRSIVRMRRT